MVLTQAEEDGLRLLLAEKRARLQLEASGEQTEAIVRPLRIALKAAEADLKTNLR